MSIQEGKTYYFYDDRAVDDVCKAHVLNILPHPEREDDRLISLSVVRRDYHQPAGNVCQLL